MAEKKTKKKHLGRGLNALLGPINLSEDSIESQIKAPKKNSVVLYVRT